MRASRRNRQLLRALVAAVLTVNAAFGGSASSSSAAAMAAMGPKERPPIVIDGVFDDWRGSPVTDPEGWRIAVAEEPRFLYVHLRQPEEAILQASEV